MLYPRVTTNVGSFQLSWRLVVTLVVIRLILFPNVHVFADEISPDPRFGAVESYMFPEAAAELGLGWDRMIIHWYQRQPDHLRQWVINQDEKLWVKQASESGREMVALLMGAPHWATDGLAGRGVPHGLYLPLNHPGNHWARFVRRVVAEYQGQIKHWVIWNEPDIASDHPGAQFDGSVHDYYQLLKVAYMAAKSVDPDAVIHMAALTFWHDVVYGREPYILRLIKVAATDRSAARYKHYFDVFTLHIYFKTDTVHELIALHRQMMEQAGLSKPIWINETNAPPMDDRESPWLTPLFPVTLEQQASFMVQSAALALGSGAERVAVYKLRDATAPAPGYEPYGLFSHSGYPRPASLAYGETIRQLATFNDVIHKANPAYHLVSFQKDSGTTLVVWARNKSSVTINLFSSASDMITIYNKYGEPQAIIPDVDGLYRLMLPPAECSEDVGCVVGGDPLFVVLKPRLGENVSVAGSSTIVLEGDSWQRIVQRICIDDLGWKLGLIEIEELAMMNRGRNDLSVGDFLRPGQVVDTVCWNPEWTHDR